MRTLASVLTQTYTEFEVIIVNDGSTDKSLDVLQNFIADSRIKIFNQENKGVSVARNKGVALSNYEHIAFLDADDEWLPGYLEKIKEAIELFPDAAMYGFPSWHRDIITGHTDNGTLNRYKDKIQEVEYFENPHTMPNSSAIVVKKKYFNMVDNGNAFPVGNIVHEDWSCFNRIAFLGALIYIGIPLAIRNNGVLGQATAINKDDKYKLLPSIVSYYNLTYKFSTLYQDKKSLFNIFFRYDLRNKILCALRESDYSTILFLLNGLTESCLNELHSFEIKLYKIKKLNSVAKLYIYFTKIIWRLNGFPVVGKAN